MTMTAAAAAVVVCILFVFFPLIILLFFSPKPFDLIQPNPIEFFFVLFSASFTPIVGIVGVVAINIVTE